MSNATIDAPKRPTLLTVTCIIQVVFAAWSIWQGYRGVFTDSVRLRMEEDRARMGSVPSWNQSRDNWILNLIADAERDMVARGPEKVKALGSFGLVKSLLVLASVWLMWNLKRSGLQLFMLVAILGIVASFVIWGSGISGLVSAGADVLGSAIFLLPFGLCYKHMH